MPLSVSPAVGWAGHLNLTLKLILSLVLVLGVVSALRSPAIISNPLFPSLPTGKPREATGQTCLT